ncbi:MAG: hypothetical protein AAF628_26350 [Planctomycetota bacterium]
MEPLETTTADQHGVVARQCPQPRNALQPLIVHRIPVERCLSRQREHYHKCHRCEYSGKPASFRLQTNLEASAE